MFTITLQNGKHYRIPTQRIPANVLPYDYWTDPPDDLSCSDATGVTQGMANAFPGTFSHSGIYADRYLKMIIVN